MNLPVELLLCVVQFMELEDFLTARLVSRSWNERFCSPDLCIGAIKVHFRSTWETSYKALQGEAQDDAKARLTGWFTEEAVKRLRRRHCNYRSTTVSPYQRLLNGKLIKQPLRNRDVMYCNGRMAYRYDEGTVTFKPLATKGPPRSFKDDDRLPIKSWLLSDQFFIAQNSHG